MAVAFIALLAALTGTAVALPGSNTVTSGDIKNSQVKTQDIKNSTVRGGDVRPNTLTGSDVAESTLGKVPSATSADSATTATNATAIADNTVTSAKVADGSLNGDDVGRVSGSVAANILSVAANSCRQTVVQTGTGVDMRDDAIVVTPEDNWPLNLNVSTEESTAIGAFRLNTCNPTAVAIDPPAVTFRFVAFDVVP